MATMYELITANEVAAYWTEKNVNRQPLLGETLFPVVREIGTNLSWIKGAKNQPVGLKLSSYDAKAIRRDMQGIEEVKTKMPFFKESVYIDEDLRVQLNNFIAANNPTLVDSILSKIFDQPASLIDASDITLERMRMELITSGVITLSSNGQSYTYNYGLGNDQKIDASANWSIASTDIIGDIEKVIEDAKAQGVVITRAIFNSSVGKTFKTNNTLKNAIYVFANGTVNVTTDRAISYLESELGISMLQYDNVYVDEQGTAHKYIPDDTIVFLPDGNLGETHKGVTPEESDLTNGLSAKVAIVNNGVAVTTSEIVDPVNVETKVSMVALPSFEMADQIYIMDTKPNA